MCGDKFTHNRQGACPIVPPFLIIYSKYVKWRNEQVGTAWTDVISQTEARVHLQNLLEYYPRESYVIVLWRVMWDRIVILYDNRKRSEQWLGIDEPQKHFLKPKLTLKKKLSVMYSTRCCPLQVLFLIKALPLSHTVQKLTKWTGSCVKSSHRCNRKGLLLLADNAKHHIAKCRKLELRAPHPPYFSNIAPTDQNIFMYLSHFLNVLDNRNSTKVAFWDSLSYLSQVSAGTRFDRNIKLHTEKILNDADKLIAPEDKLLRKQCDEATGYPTMKWREGHISSFHLIEVNERVKNCKRCKFPRTPTKKYY